MNFSSDNVLFAVLGLLLSALILATLPAILNIVSRWLRAHYRRLLWKSPTADPDAAPAPEIENAASSVPLMPAGEVAPSAHPARAEAAATTRDVQIAHVIAALVYAISVATIIGTFVTIKPLETRLAMVYASLAPQLLIVLWTLRVEGRQKLKVFLIYGAAGLLPAFLAGSQALLVMTWAAVFALLIIPALLLLIDRVIEPFAILMLPVLFVIFGVGIFLDGLEAEYTRQGEEVLKGLRPWLLLFGIGSAVAGFYLGRVLLRQRWPARAIAGALGLIALLVLNPKDNPTIPAPIGIAADVGVVVLEMLVIGALFQFLVWLERRHALSNELLQIHLAWGWLTLYFELWALMNDTFVGLRWWFACAFVLSTVVLHVLLFLLRRRRRLVVPKRLLVLRSFGGPDERQDLLDDLRDTWRRVGSVDIIAAQDVATHVLQPDMLAAFVLRRTGEQFLGTRKAALKWVEGHRGVLEVDARYSENAAFCLDDAWRDAVLSLIKTADAVLMDVRDFTLAHVNCADELKMLRDENRLPRVVFIANSGTDGESIRALLPGYELRMLDFEPRTRKERFALFDLLLKVAYA